MRRLLYIAGIALLLCGVRAEAQSVNELKKQIERYNQEIRISTELLEKTKKDQKASQSQLSLIQSRIRSRKNVLASLEKQVGLINNDITSANRRITSLGEDAAKLKKEYGEMVYAAYKNYKLNNFLLFLFASEDFNDATRRIEFMRRYNRTREQKAAEITALADRISA